MNNFMFQMRHEKQTGDSSARHHNINFKQLDQPLNFQAKSKSKTSDVDSMNEKLTTLIESFQKISINLESGLTVQNVQTTEFQLRFSESVLNKMDQMISVNRQMSEGIKKMINFSEISIKQGTRTCQSLKIINEIVTPLVYPTELDEVTRRKSFSLIPEEIQSSFLQTLQEPISMHMLRSTSIEEVKKSQIFNSIVQVYSSESNNEKPIKQYLGNFERQSAEFYFNEFRNGKISYEDMKIKFSYDLLDETSQMMRRWHKTFYEENSEFKNHEQQVNIKIQFFDHYNSALQNTLNYLLCKYPPSRRKIVDTELSDKIVATKDFSLVEHDMLRNADMKLGLEDNQTNFNKDIKCWVNKLISQTNKQFPEFKQRMKRMFMGRQSSIEGYIDEVQYSIGRKLPQGTMLYTQCEMDSHSLQIKSPQVLRILMKWCDQLKLYFVDQKNKIFNNKYGFKSTKMNVPIKLPGSRLQLLSEHLTNAYTKIMKQVSQQQKKEIGLLFTDLLMLTVSEVEEGYEQLNSREITILKLAEYLNESLKFYVGRHLNEYLSELSKIRKLYGDDKPESNINLITFGVMDLLRCKCVASKAEIYRIYREIMNSTQYFEVIRVKNKLNESTRDILINLKLKKSFLICEIQLSLGQSKEETNDQFCHYLYELERSSFSPAFECASQICNLDPRMTFIKKEKNLKLKGSDIIKSFIKDKTEIIKQDIFCSIGHPPTLTEKNPSYAPYTCLLCANFVNSNSTCLYFSRCPKCYINICPLCLIKFFHPDNKEFEKWFTTRYIECDHTITFFSKYFLEHSTVQRSVSKSNVFQYLKDYDYVMHMSVDGTGHIPVIYKKHKKYCINTFATLIEPHPKSWWNDVSWNFITPAQPHVVKKINQLQNYLKFHLTLEWADLEQLLIQNNIEQVVCIISEQFNSVLIIDIIQTQQQIQCFNTNKNMQKIIDKCNQSNQSEIELTSQTLSSIECLKNIKHKQNIKQINLWQNRIQDISSIKEFKNLTNIVFKQNKIKSMSDITELKKLERVLLGNNQIDGELPTLLLPKLRVLGICKNNITSVMNLKQSDLQQLMILNISFMKIKQIPQITAPKMFLLQCVGNPIQSIDNFILLSKVPNLTKILFKDCKIKTVPRINLPSLKQINFRNNEIVSIDSFCLSQSKLEMVNLSHNKIVGRIPSFEKLSSLSSINLSHNDINLLLDNTFNIPSLCKLDLSNNQIQNPFPSFSCESILELNLSNNKFSDINNLSVTKLPNMKHLNLSFNEIINLPCIKFRRLQTLDLSFNKVNSVGVMFDWKLPDVLSIKLNNNNITGFVPRLYLQKIEVLDVSHNIIDDLIFISHKHLLTRLSKVVVQGNANLIRKYKQKSNSKITFE